MIAEIGHFALILATGVALFQFLVPLYAAHRGDQALMRTGLTAAVMQLASDRAVLRGADACLPDLGFLGSERLREFAFRQAPDLQDQRRVGKP
jgi:hypothetical protein